jgi:glycosyltransferase involved in cell wall biosynthesis
MFTEHFLQMEIEFVQEIPSPYRVDFLNAVHEISPSMKVHFLADNQTHRPTFWKDSLRKTNFSHRIWRDWGFRVRGRKIHLNLGLINYLRSSTGTIIVGGVWSNLTVLLICLLFNQRCIAWVELNEFLLQPNWLKRFLKRKLLSRFPAVIVPGSLGVRALRLLKYQGSVIELPNLIDGNLFKVAPVDVLHRKNNNVKIAIWPARLIKSKGITEFISQLSVDMLRRWKIIIVGEGNLSGEVQRIISERNLNAYIELVGYVPYEQMTMFYKSANLFLLPSLHDPNPLSAIEALYAGLPIILSKYCGNFPEVIKGDNGWVIDPFADNRLLLKEIFMMSHEELLKKGEHSAVIACADFDMAVNACGFIENVKIHAAS